MHLAHVTIAVSKIEAAAAFYQAVFGWPQISRPNHDGPRGAWLQIGPGQELHLTQLDSFEPSPYEDEFGRHLAIAVSATEFDVIEGRLRKQSTQLVAPKRETPFRRLFFQDPSGYVVELAETN